MCSSARSTAGTSKDESSDTNDFLSFDLESNGVYEIHAGQGAGARVVEFRADASKQKIVDIVLFDASEAKFEKAVAAWFAAKADTRDGMEFDEGLDSFVTAKPERARPLAWHAF